MFWFVTERIDVWCLDGRDDSWLEMSDAVY